MGLESAGSKKRRVSNRSRKTAASKRRAPPAEFEDFYAPHITDPDPPQEMMSRNETRGEKCLQGESRPPAQLTTVSSELVLCLASMREKPRTSR